MSTGRQVPAAAVVHALVERGETLAVAESLTGGLLSAAIVEIAGVSAVFRGGLVVYATDLKESLAGVPGRLLAERGPVDPDVAVALADGVRARCGAHWGLSHHGCGRPGAAGRQAGGHGLRRGGRAAGFGRTPVVPRGGPGGDPPRSGDRRARPAGHPGTRRLAVTAPYAHANGKSGLTLIPDRKPDDCARRGAGRDRVDGWRGKMSSSSPPGTVAGSLRSAVGGPRQEEVRWSCFVG